MPLSKIGIIAVVIAFTFVACDSNGGSDLGPAPSASGVAISDVGNLGNGSDIEVFFRKPIPDTGVASYRIFVVKESFSRNV